MALPEPARRVGEGILGIRAIRYSEPRVETDFHEPRRSPGRLHIDVWFLVDGVPSRAAEPEKPRWYAELDWKEPRTLPASAYERGHEDVVRWTTERPKAARSTP